MNINFNYREFSIEQINFVNAYLSNDAFFSFKDGKFKIYTAHFINSEIKVVFRVRIDSDPESRAEQKGIRGFYKIIPSHLYEVVEWMLAHEVVLDTYSDLFEITV
jgi:hypothetical protein